MITQKVCNGNQNDEEQDTRTGKHIFKDNNYVEWQK